jgi:hypothetical protein
MKTKNKNQAFNSSDWVAGSFEVYEVLNRGKHIFVDTCPSSHGIMSEIERHLAASMNLAYFGSTRELV